MSKKHPPKVKHYSDLKQRAKALCTNLMYAIYKAQIREGFSDEEALLPENPKVQAVPQ